MPRRAISLIPLWVALTALTISSGRDLRLVDAAKEQQPTLLRSLLNQKVDANSAAVDGTTALHWVAHWNDLSSADLLIRAGANVNATTDLDVTPLALACINGSAAMVGKLLDAGANARAVLSTGETALMTCSRTGNAEAVRSLLAHGADVNAREKSHDQTALMWAVAERHSDVAQMLIEHGADIHAHSGITREFVMRRLFFKERKNTGVWIDRGGNTPLLFAARVGDLDSARVLLSAGASPNEASPNGNTALLIAAHSGHGKLAVFLLDKGSDPNACGIGFNALHTAVLTGDLALVKALLAHGANPNAKLTNGAPLRRGDSDPLLPADLAGATPFLLAAKYVDVPIMRVLLASGANPSTATNDKTTALMAAAGVGWSGGTDRRGSYLIEAPPFDEDQALATAKILIDLGADVTASNDDGDTALHGAASKGYTRIIQLLVSKGANINAKDKEGRTPLAMTRASGVANGQRSLKETAELLRRLGAAK